MSRAALVAGAGGAVGTAVCQALASRGWRVVAVGRDGGRLTEELGGAAHQVLAIDLADPESTRRGLAGLEPVEALVYNAGRLDLLPLAETTAEIFEASWRVNALGAFQCARALAPAMVERGRGAMLFVGATASWRGGARTHAFAASKHALRGLAGSLAKELGPRGVHVAHLVLDGKVWGERTRRRFPDATAETCIDPGAVAATILGLLEQDRSAWTFELDLRPDVERWS